MCLCMCGVCMYACIIYGVYVYVCVVCTMGMVYVICVSLCMWCICVSVMYVYVHMLCMVCVPGFPRMWGCVGQDQIALAARPWL